MPDNKRKVICPECEKDVEIVDGEGECPNCGLDVGWVLEKHRRDKAVAKLAAREEEEAPKPKTKKRLINF
jgi:endogenous inhibitor of DNA gyrase (YacG/DUF329 family)